MRTHPLDFFSLFVRPDYDDYFTDRNSYRRAFHLAVSLFHLSDHVFQYCERNRNEFFQFEQREEYIKHICSQLQFFHVLQNMANVYKHLYSNSEKSYIELGSPGGILSRNMELSDGADDVAIWLPKRKISISFSEISTDAFKWWKKELTRIFPNEASHVLQDGA